MRTNKDRADAGREAMDFYMDNLLYSQDREEADALTDFLADLMHAYGDKAVLACINTAYDHYEFETAYEEEQ